MMMIDRRCWYTSRLLLFSKSNAKTGAWRGDGVMGGESMVYRAFCVLVFCVLYTLGAEKRGLSVALFV